MNTLRLGLSRFGGRQGGQISDDGYKFSGRDRVIMDRFLAALEGHNHVANTRLVDPVAQPALTLTTTAGQLPAGVTAYYKVSFLDIYDLETAASTEVSISTPNPVQPPTQPALTASTGGTLAPGLHQYLVTATQTNGETTPSGVSSISLLSGQNSIVLNMAALPTGATGYKIYRQAPGESQPFYLGATATTAFTDNGGVSTATITPPTANTTNSTNQVTVTIPDVTAGGLVPTGVVAWRIYRTFVSGYYGDAALVHEVVEHTSETDPTTPLVTTFIDAGDPLRDGLPLTTSTTFQQPPPASGAGSTTSFNGAAAGLSTPMTTQATVQLAIQQLDTLLKGFVRMPFSSAAVPASSTDLVMKVEGVTGAVVVAGSLAGYVLDGLTINSSAVLTGGQVTAQVLVNGAVVTGATLVLASGAAKGYVVFATAQRTVLAAGDDIKVTLTSTAAFAPAADIIATVEVTRR